MKVKRLIFLLLMIGLFVQLFYISQYTVFAYWNNETIAEVKDTDIILNEDEVDALQLVNEYRMKNGLPKLKISEKLQEIAQIKANRLL